ncbi:hypothetical protein SETIT_3G214800v2 [Setaria italica]|uniref:Uncharacterized protein n=1 Tax=Setaria italica TaxID=4555 RepID=A0A368QHJ0_SETIT|nr:hypothetical protein SETIT_3G214800v2 [Setaria italica]
MGGIGRAACACFHPRAGQQRRGGKASNASSAETETATHPTPLGSRRSVRARRRRLTPGCLPSQGARAVAGRGQRRACAEPRTPWLLALRAAVMHQQLLHCTPPVASALRLGGGETDPIGQQPSRHAALMLKLFVPGKLRQSGLTQAEVGVRHRFRRTLSSALLVLLRARM